MLKKYSGIISSLSVIIPLVSVIAGIALAIMLESFMMFVYFAVAAALAYIFMASYSELLDVTADNQMLLEQIEKELKEEQERIKTSRNGNQTVATAPTANDVKAPCTENTGNDTLPEKADEESGYTVDPSNPDFIICSKCGRSQKSNRTVCFDCGAKFKK